MKLKRYVEAEAAYDQALALDPTNAGAWAGKGEIYGERQQIDQALTAYTTAIQSDPKNAGAWQGRGLVYLISRRYEEAVHDFNQAFQINPSGLTALSLKAYAQRLDADYESALATYEQILTLEPNAAQVWMDMSSVLRVLGRHEEALEAENRAYEIANASPPSQQVPTSSPATSSQPPDRF